MNSKAIAAVAPTDIFQAIRSEDLKTLRKFHAAGVSLDEVRFFAGRNQTPLEFAVREGKDEVLRFFSDIGLGSAETAPEALKDARAKAAAKERARVRKAEREAKRNAAPPRIPAALKVQLERLGFTLSDAPLEASENLEGITEKTRWLKHLTAPPGVFRAGDGVRGLRFCRPFTIASPLPALQGAHSVVLGITPGHWLTVPAASEGAVFFVPTPSTLRAHTERRKLPTFLANLTPDTGHPSARPVSDPVTLSPTLEALVIASLAEAGVHDVAPGAMSREALAELRTLRVEHLDTIAELDERFASLDTLVIRGAKLNDLTSLTRLPQLKRLMLDRCALEDVPTLGSLTQLAELHLPNCLLNGAQLGFLEKLPSLKAVTLTGNRLESASPEFLRKMPPGLAPKRTGEPDPETLRAWPASRRGDPGATLYVPDAILAQLERLGVQVVPGAEIPPNLRTATARHLAQVRWPSGALKTRPGARREMKDFEGRRLQVSEWLCIGAYDAGHLLVTIAGGDDPDPHVSWVDLEEPKERRLENHYPLSEFLRSLEAP